MPPDRSTQPPDAPLEAGRRVLAEEAAALRRLAGALGPDFVAAVELLGRPGGLRLVTGVGKSGLVGAKIAATLSSIGLPATSLHAADALHGDSGLLLAASALVAISHSGETPEVLAVAELALDSGVGVISITGTRDCALARVAAVPLVTGVTAEADRLGLAPTASTSATLALGDALAMAAGSLIDRTPEGFRRWHPGGALGARLAARPEPPRG